MYEISALARRFAPWSISKAECVETCAAQFEHKYIKKTEAVSITSATVGTCAHSILEFRVEGKTAEVALAEALAKTPLTHDEMETLRTFDEQIEGFLKRWDAFVKREGVTKVLLEAEWAIDDMGNACPYDDKQRAFFRGKIDLGAVTRSNDLVVVDHKSGIARKQLDAKKKRQLNSYAVMGLANVPGLAGVRGGIHFLQGPPDLRSQWMDYIPAEKIRKVYTPWLFQYINFCAEKAEAPFEAKPKLRWPCEWCGFQAACPAFNEMMRASEI